MSLFKNLLISHDIMKFEDDYLMLHCSREDFVKAPFDGELSIGNSSCILSNDDFKLYISNIAITEEQPKNVKAGHLIGKPMVQSDIAYILVKLYKNNNLEDIITYLNFKDNTEIKPKSLEKVYNTNTKSSNKKRTNKKK
jgi:hypothetical protein